MSCDKNPKQCKHVARATRDKDKYKLLKDKQDLFNCDNWKDFVYISYLDRIHSLILHSTDLRETKEDAHKIKKYTKFPVYSTGVFIQYDVSSPLHMNLKKELINNAKYSISESDFESALAEAHHKMKTETWKKQENQWRAHETNEIYGIKINDLISIEHLLCIKLYCDHSNLCTEFRKSYRAIDYDDNHTETTKYHCNKIF